MDFERDRQGGPNPQGTSASLLLGPGRPHELERLLRGQDPSREILRMSDLAELINHQTCQALLDGALVPSEDLGIVRRALQSGRIEVTLLGGNPASGPLREILKHPRTRWLPYPPDSEELGQLAGRADIAPAPPQVRQPESAPEEPPTVDLPEAPLAEDPNLVEIEAILNQPAAALQTAELSELGEVEHPPSDHLPPPEPNASAPATWKEAPHEEASAPLLSAPPHRNEPPWFKDQVADLTDLVQAIYVSTASFDLEGGDAGPPGLQADVLRLVQFTRTLGYLASPPARGETEIELSTLCEELLRSAQSTADAPRFVMRTAEPLTIRANKELVVQAMDAILVLARLCAGPEGEVRLTSEETGGAMVTLRLSFPCGPLEGLKPEEIVLPYALRSKVPEMGKNALRAATSIIEGQGGSLALAAVGEGQLSFTLSLPSA